MNETTSPAPKPRTDLILLVLRIATCSLFLGRGTLYLSKRSPLSTFFWHQDWLEEPLKNWLDISWEHWAATSEPFIISTQNTFGALFLISAIACWWVGPGRKNWAFWVVLVGMVGLIPYWLLMWVEKNFQFAMFLEHFLQWGTPLLLALYGRMKAKWWLVLTGAFVSFTFIGHGLYAIGLGVPRDNEFINMCIRLIKVDEEGAKTFLSIVGWIDVILPAMFLIPRLRIPALGYAALWGLTTAISRIPAHFTRAEAYYGLHPWTAEAVVRLTHGLVPLAMLLLVLEIYRRWKEESRSP